MTKIIYSVLVVLILLIVPSRAFAQSGFNVASEYEVAEKDAQNGDIVISTDKGLVRTQVTYDTRIFGVITDNPLLVLRESTGSGKQNLRPVIRIGDTSVNVSNFNGDVKRGDYITSSPLSGKGMKSGQAGSVVGIALQDAQYGTQSVNFQGKSYKLGTVWAAISVTNSELSSTKSSFALLNSINSLLVGNVKDPEKFTLVIRYLIAGLIALVAFAISFFTVTRALTKAIEAIGRNPLARNTIIAGLIFQVAATAIGAIATIVIIYIVVRV